MSTDDHPNDLSPAAALEQLLRVRGHAILDDADLLRGLLLDYCPLDQSAVNGLVAAAVAGVPKRILDDGERSAPAALVQVLASGLSDRHNMTARSAEQVVRTWHEVLRPGTDIDAPSARHSRLDGASHSADPDMFRARAVRRRRAVFAAKIVGCVLVAGVLFAYLFGADPSTRMARVANGDYFGLFVRLPLLLGEIAFVAVTLAILRDMWTRH